MDAIPGRPQGPDRPGWPAVARTRVPAVIESARTPSRPAHADDRQALAKLRLASGAADRTAERDAWLRPGGGSGLAAQLLSGHGGGSVPTQTAAGAALAYRKQGALPLLYPSDPTIFRVEV